MLYISFPQRFTPHSIPPHYTQHTYSSNTTHPVIGARCRLLTASFAPAAGAPLLDSSPTTERADGDCPVSDAPPLSLLRWWPCCGAGCGGRFKRRRWVGGRWGMSGSSLSADDTSHLQKRHTQAAAEGRMASSTTIKGEQLQGISIPSQVMHAAVLTCTKFKHAAAAPSCAPLSQIINPTHLSCCARDGIPCSPVLLPLPVGLSHGI